MRKIEDICLGRMEYINTGNDIVVDIWSTYDGRCIYKVYCRKFSKVEIKNNFHENETFFGVYVALLTISNEDGEAKLLLLWSLVIFLLKLSVRISYFMKCNSFL